MICVDEAPARAATAPPTRWQNIWRVIQDLSGAPVDPIDAGSLVVVKRFHPSADVARTVAQQEMREVFARKGVFGSFDHCLEYVDAFPEGERPKQAPATGEE